MKAITRVSNNMDSCEYDALIKTVIVGDSQVGKTSIIRRIVDGAYIENEQPTIGVEFCTTTGKHFNGSIVKFQFWDCSGNPSYRHIIKSYFDDARLILFVFSMNDISTINELYLLYELLKKRFIRPENAVFIVVGTKTDLLEASEPLPIPNPKINTYINYSSWNALEHIAATRRGKTFAQNIGADYVEVSAKTGYNINNLFELCALKCVLKHHVTPKIHYTYTKPVVAQSKDDNDKDDNDDVMCTICSIL
jgi:small GTP-binding protein